MSLQLAAQHLASHGRGDDKVLVHMTRGEVKSLNDLAMAHGGHLTINPHTGLPEAGFLKAMLPMIIGAGLAAATGGTSLAVSPMMAAGIVGAGYTAATGSVKQGLMAGLGAYGGAGMGSSLAASGTATGTAGVATEAPQIANANMADAYKGVGQMQNGVNPNAFGASVPPVEGMNPANYQITPQDLANQKMAEIEAASNGARSSMDGLNGAKVAQASQLSGATQNALANPTSAGLSNATGSWQGAKDFLGANKVPLIAGGVAALTNTDPTKPQEIKSDADQGQRFNYQANPTAAATGAVPNPNIPSYEQMMSNPQNFGAEQRYFNHQYVNRAEGGPVEDMSTAATLGENTMYPMANMRSSAFATPYQTPQSTNMMQSMAPSGGGTVNMMSGEPNMQGTRMATGGISDAHYNLGGYSDGGRLLRGPGDGVSDDIPAMIGEKQPARLADGEFVVPARIVSELGNGSTEAGARKLYAMMDRVQSARKKTVGKDRIAHNSRAEKYLPA
jgi:hypothetical protein